MRMFIVMFVAVAVVIAPGFVEADNDRGETRRAYRQSVKEEKLAQRLEARENWLAARKVNLAAQKVRKAERKSEAEAKDARILARSEELKIERIEFKENRMADRIAKMNARNAEWGVK